MTPATRREAKMDNRATGTRTKRNDSRSAGHLSAQRQEVTRTSLHDTGLLRQGDHCPQHCNTYQSPQGPVIPSIPYAGSIPGAGEAAGTTIFAFLQPIVGAFTRHKTLERASRQSQCSRGMSSRIKKLVCLFPILGAPSLPLFL